MAEHIQPTTDVPLINRLFQYSLTEVNRHIVQHKRKNVHGLFIRCLA